MRSLWYLSCCSWTEIKLNRIPDILPKKQPQLSHIFPHWNYLREIGQETNIFDEKIWILAQKFLNIYFKDQMDWHNIQIHYIAMCCISVSLGLIYFYFISTTEF